MRRNNVCSSEPIINFHRATVEKLTKLAHLRAIYSRHGTPWHRAPADAFASKLLARKWKGFRNDSLNWPNWTTDSMIRGVVCTDPGAFDPIVSRSTNYRPIVYEFYSSRFIFLKSWFIFKKIGERKYRSRTNITCNDETVQFFLV